jgi:hypothetical protein
MKTMIIISILISSLLSQDFTKKEFSDKVMNLGWDYEYCAFGSSGDHINGNIMAQELATTRAIDKIAMSKCGKRKGNTISTSAEFGYTILLQGKVENKFIVAICARKPVKCTNK